MTDRPILFSAPMIRAISDDMLLAAGTINPSKAYLTALVGIQNLPNVWLGVSVEDQIRADERIPDLLATPAAIRFISAEPLLGPLDLRRWLSISWQCSSCRGYFAGRYQSICPECGQDGGWCGSHAYNGRGRQAHAVIPPQSGRGLDWVIVGGESGKGSRPMHPDWARDIRDQCGPASVPFFFKQWGEWAPNIGAVDGWALGDDPEISRFDHREWEDGQWGEVFRPMWCDFSDGNYDEAQCVSRIGTKTAGRMLDGNEHNAMPKGL